jgi:hypothetical protein
VGGLIKGTVVGILAGAVLAAVVGSPAASAEALSPWWGVTSGSQPTNLVSGETKAGRIVVTAENRGDASTSGEVTISDRLPAGLEATGIKGVADEDAGGGGRGPASCTLATLTCVFSGSLHPYEEIEVEISVSVGAGAVSGEQNTASVSGGGAAGTVSASDAIEVDGRGRFGVEDYELIPENAGGSIDTQAGSHPFQLTSVLTLKTTTPEPNGGPRAVALPKDISTALPAGLIADPEALVQCTEAQFNTETEVGNACSAQSAVGVATVTVYEPLNLGFETVTTPIFNMTPLAGEPARFAIQAASFSVFLKSSIRSGGDYGVTLSSENITEAVLLLSLKLTFWGAPGDSRHDDQRGWACLEGSGTCMPPAETAALPFLTMGTSCAAPFQSTVQGDSWSASGDPSDSEQAEPITYTLRGGLGEPLLLGGCKHLPFAPEVAVTSDGAAASTPSGLDVDVHVPQASATGPEAVAESSVKDIAITLPAGVALNAAGANGLETCSEAQVGFTGFGELNPVSEAGVETALFTPTLPFPSCPSAAKIGTARITTPLLAGPLVGSVYLAAQDANPFGSFVAVYVSAEEPASGVLVRLPGEMLLSPQTGQITATFETTPQIPIEDIELHFFGGALAPLAMPAHCGSYTTSASFTPWSAEPWNEAAVTVGASSTFDIMAGPNGGVGGLPCPGTSLPFAPSLTAGTTNIDAGSFSSLTAMISREDGEQQLQGLYLHLPPGLSAMLASVALCPEAQANAGTCSPSSQIGETTISAGVGGDPYTLTGGKVYLTEGYEGAPFGLAIVTPMKVGPLDLEDAPENHPACDCLAIRAKIEIDTQTAQLTIVSAAIPHIIDGVPLQIKHLGIAINREGFIFNSTDCNKMAITSMVTSTEGAVATPSTPFQLANCKSLKFTPKLTAVTRANGELAGHGASLHLALAPVAGGANLRSLKLDLPQRLPARLGTIQRACPEKTFDQNPAGCAKASVVGSASVHTPILSSTMTGPAYLVAKSGSGTSHPGESKVEKEEAAFPNLVLVLQGEGVKIDLTGALFVSAKNITSVAFRAIPDVPILRMDLVLPEGKTSILAASSGLCTKRPLRITTAITGQDGARVKPGVTVGVSGCRKPKKRRQKRRHAKKAHKR